MDSNYCKYFKIIILLGYSLVVYSRKIKLWLSSSLAGHDVMTGEEFAVNVLDTNILTSDKIVINLPQPRSAF